MAAANESSCSAEYTVFRFETNKHEINLDYANIMLT